MRLSTGVVTEISSLETQNAQVYYLMSADESGFKYAIEVWNSEKKVKHSSIASIPPVGNFSYIHNKYKPKFCLLGKVKDQPQIYQQMIYVSSLAVSQVERSGGLLIHGGVIAKDGLGILIAGPGKVGKSTASKRIPAPWQSISDDAAVIVRHADGLYYVYPWPTWSRIVLDHSTESWDIQHGYPLKAVCILNKSERDKMSRLGQGHSVPPLVNLTEQVSWQFWHNKRSLYKTRMHRFENICEMVKCLPCFQLNISRNGEFWLEIESTLGI